MDSPLTSDGNQSKMTFWNFYDKVFLAEHQHLANVAFHVVGTLAGLAYLITIPLFAATQKAPWMIGLLPLFPVVHAVPGLIGHKLFEPNPDVGDVRVFRKDYPTYWFLFGNHVMTMNIFLLRHKPFGKRDEMAS
jgi:hypothetical protein